LGTQGANMIKKVIVRGPALSQSGYGEHTRFLLRSLRQCPDKFDIYLIPLNWGQTGWLHEDSEERNWMDEVIKKTLLHTNNGGQFDMSIQVSIPNEWDKLAPYNVGVTAGIETTKVAPVWLEKVNMMDKVVTISEHSKQVFESTTYQGTNRETGQQVLLKCDVPIDIVHYPVKEVESDDLELELEYKFNYLMVSQWGPRKNMENAIKWWIEENYDEKVGLVLKTSLKNNCIMDREHVTKNLKSIIEEISPSDMKCKIYLLHGDLSEGQMQSLYTNPKIKCLINLSHGEGFGLPLFDAACHGLPVITPGWSGQCDFLYMKQKNGKSKAMFADVNYDIAPVQDFAVWEGVIQKDSMWCYPHEGHYKIRLRQVRKGHGKWLKKAKVLQAWVLENFNSEKQHQLFADSVYGEVIDVDSWLEELNTEIVEHE
jgi:glycosyltransferase involved in cell wall biosynthesis